MRNWAGNIEYGARRLHEPTSVEQVQDLVRSSTAARAIGTRHAFNDLADTPGDLVSLARLPRRIEVDAAARTVAVDGGMRYGDLCGPLDRAGSALHNLASLPHISVAGACATATHGSGNASGCLSTAVVELDLVRADGELVTLRRAEAPALFAGSVVALGALGIVTRLVLAVEPRFSMRQDVYEDLPLVSLLGGFDDVTAAADSVSLFTTWRRPVIDHVWLKRRVESGAALEPAPATFRGAVLADGPRHPVPGGSPDACTAQLGVPGPWFERLPHFRMGHTPSSGDELQSEYLVGREHAPAAFEALAAIAGRIAPLVQVSEIRTIAADDLWLSPAFGRDSVAFHWTWRPDWPGVRALLPSIEAALRPFEPRPHWAKLFTMDPDELRSRYERLPAFVRLAESLDPDGKLRNAFLRRNLFAE